MTQGWRFRRAAVLYAASLAAFTFLSFYLHYLSHRLPFAQAQQRIVASFASETRDEGFVHEYKNTFEYCQSVSAFLSGTRPDPRKNPVQDAIYVRRYFRKYYYQETYCRGLYAAAIGEAIENGILKARYAWGSAAVFGLALRFLSAQAVRHATLWGTYGAYALLALALLYLNRRALLVGAPLAAFGLCFSGARFWADFVTGFPYLWAVAATILLAVLTRHYGPRGVTRLFSCVAGMVSMYLWAFDGHQTVLLAGFGLVAYFGPREGRPAGRRRATLGCLAAYAGGFLAGYALNQGVKFAAVNLWAETAGYDVRSVSAQVMYYLQRMGTELALAFQTDLRRLPLIREFPVFLTLGRNRLVHLPALALTGALACVAASAYALYRARRGQPTLLMDMLWIWGLGALTAAQFFLPSDVPFRIGRLWFVLLALAWACPLLAARTLPAPLALLLIGSLCLVPIGAEVRAQALRRAWIAGLETRAPVADAFFDVYLDPDARTLTLWRAPCQRRDALGSFFLYFWPTAEALARPRPPRDPLLIFRFPRYGVQRDGQCLATIPMPPYAVRRIVLFRRALPDLRLPPALPAETLQLGDFAMVPGNLHRAGGSGRLRAETQWIAAFAGPGWNPLVGRNPRAQYQAVTARAPAAQAAFDLYLTDETLAYVKRPCRPADVAAKFFLHAFPTEAHALPAERQALGFDIDSFFFDEQGARVDDACLALAWWPPYGRAGLDRIVTGQWFPDADRLVWKTDVLLFNGQPVPDWPALFQATATAAPAAQGAFAVYPAGRGLVVARDPCRPGDTEAPFFLHVVPRRRRDLPATRQESGFDNYDFRFADRGAHFDGRCAAAVNLPAYGIRRVRIGQWRPQDGQEIWKVEISLD